MENTNTIIEYAPILIVVLGLIFGLVLVALEKMGIIIL